MITICQHCKQAMDVEGFRLGDITMHQDCAYLAHRRRLAKFMVINTRIKNAKLTKANRERKERERAEQAKSQQLIEAIKTTVEGTRD